MLNVASHPALMVSASQNPDSQYEVKVKPLHDSHLSYSQHMYFFILSQNLYLEFKWYNYTSTTLYAVVYTIAWNFWIKSHTTLRVGIILIAF